MAFKSPWFLDMIGTFLNLNILLIKSSYCLTNPKDAFLDFIFNLKVLFSYRMSFTTKIIETKNLEWCYLQKDVLPMYEVNSFNSIYNKQSKWQNYFMSSKVLEEKVTKF